MTRRLVALLCLLSIGCAADPPPKPASANEGAAAIDQSFRNQRPPPLPAVTYEHPQPELAHLGNGFALWVLERDTPTLSLRITCRVGSRDNPDGKAGLAAFTTRLMTEGTMQKTSLQLATAVETLGTSLYQDSGRDSSSLGLEVLSEHEALGVELLAEVSRSPGFRNADVTRVRREWLDDLDLQRQDPSALAWLGGMRALLGPRLGVSTRGSPGDIASISPDDVRLFHASQWTPERCGLLAVGPTSMGNIEGLALDHFGGWRPGKVRSPKPEGAPAPPAQTTVYVFDRPGAVQTALFVGALAPPRYAPGHEARQTLNNLFGGLFTSRLNLNLREKHAYTYGAYSSLVTSRDWGIWAVSTSVRTDVTAPALEQIMLELQQLRAPGSITPDEFERSRTDLIFHNDASLEHNSELLDELDELLVYEMPTDYFANYRSTLEALTLESLAEQQAHVPARGLVIVLVGDQSKLQQAGSFAPERRDVGLQWLDRR
jgi:zinc protease